MREVAAAAVMIAVAGCGGAPELAEEPMAAQEATVNAPGGASQPEALDYGPKASIDGYARFDGDCRTFPYSLQYPSAWEVQPSRGTAIAKTRTDDVDFGIGIREDYGSVHAANLESSVLAQGATEVCSIEVGGRSVRVLNLSDRYVLHTPHGMGVFLHYLEVRSTLGVEETLRILNTLEPLGEC
jgi:hypothetical protein